MSGTALYSFWRSSQVYLHIADFCHGELLTVRNAYEIEKARVLLDRLISAYAWGVRGTEAHLSSGAHRERVRGPSTAEQTPGEEFRPERPQGRRRGPDLDKIKARTALFNQLRRELATVQEDMLSFHSLEQLKKRHPQFRLWSVLSEAEQKELLAVEFRPLPYAKTLVLKQYGVTSKETLKKDRLKLRQAHIDPHSL